MLGTALSRTRAPYRDNTPGVPSAGLRLPTSSNQTRAWFSAAWLVFAVVNAALVFVMVGEETIPYHLIWASFALMYGFWQWPRTLTRTVFGVITVVTGIPLVLHAGTERSDGPNAARSY